ncbi:hypothetical protein TWF694_001619 [Orbilia ellipsospora]|uniref:Transmembrane protein n=1 Tax=Orbilia ellipsospora TaxID=2528407 RepID=A0AAV9X366_9PEZI
MPIEISNPEAGKHKEFSLLAQTIVIGAIAGSSAGLIGAIVATIRGHPRKSIYVIGTSLNCFALGSGFYAIRELYSRKLFKFDAGQPQRGRDKIILTGAAAASTAAIWGAVIGGRRHAIPGFLVFGITGSAAQLVYNIIDSNKKNDTATDQVHMEQNSKGGIISQILTSQNNPIRLLTKEEYIQKLQEKQLVLDADIALVDEEIERLRQKLEKEKDHKESNNDR